MGAKRLGHRQRAVLAAMANGQELCRFGAPWTQVVVGPRGAVSTAIPMRLFDSLRKAGYIQEVEYRPSGGQHLYGLTDAGRAVLSSGSGPAAGARAADTTTTEGERCAAE